ncbi:cuticle protein 16.8 [Trichonephila inaurata madagascariensis]|uniref:Cuticle protein 16.8 n=1 Tax=Trichonephila inaurata madagascariensis TaxID=2747483 RepID=A0A8X7BWV6_9ARAC|nr:cuticle protein 16.8 [Trichonephila inaurata madagascariensis]
MFSKIVFLAFFGIAAASLLPLHVPVHHVEHHAPQPYAFGYSVKDHHSEQHREEAGDGHAVREAMDSPMPVESADRSTTSPDHGGFRAQVKTNEPGTANQNPAAVHLISDAPYAHGAYPAHGYEVVPVVKTVVVDAHPGYGHAAPLAGHHGYVAPLATVPVGHDYGLTGALLGGLGYPRYGF